MRLTDRETDVMNVLWEHGASTVAEVHLHLEGTLAYTTVLTMLRTLERKKSVSRVKEGRAHRYAPRLARKAVRQRAIGALTQKFFRGSTEALLVHLLEQENPSDAELARLRGILRTANRDRT